EQSTGNPSGVCANAAGCSAPDAGCASGICAQDPLGTYCRQSCSGAGGCRPAYACLDPDLDSSTSNSYCVPLCVSDNDCMGSGANYGCNPWSKKCESRDKGLAKYGAACANDNACESGQCLSNGAGNECIGFCSKVAKACGGDGVCGYSSGG